MAKNNLNVVKIAARQEELSVEEEVIMTVSDFNIQQRLIASAEEKLYFGFAELLVELL